MSVTVPEPNVPDVLPLVAPVKITVPEPDSVNPTAPLILPLTVNVPVPPNALPLFKVMGFVKLAVLVPVNDPVNVTVLALVKAMLLRFSVAPDETVVPLVLPKAPALFNCNVPALTDVAPLYPLLPDKIVVPLPDCVNEPVPLIALLTV